MGYGEGERGILVKAEMFPFFTAENAECAERIGFLGDLSVLCGEFLGLLE
jgi:hypothetical protein